MTTEFDSARIDAELESRPQPAHPHLSRREARLLAEQEKVEQIARERERERIRERAVKRAEEIRLEKEANAARDADVERFQEQINNSQQIPTLPKDAMLFPSAITPSARVVDATPPAAKDKTPASDDYSARHPGAAKVSKKSKRAEKRAQRTSRATSSRPASRTPKPRTHKLRNALGRSFVVTVVSGLLAVLALPATGFNATNTGWAVEQKNADQSVKVAAMGSEAEQVSLGEYAVTTYSDLLKLTYGASAGFKYAVNNTGKIRWPFPVIVPISSGFGGRVAPCLGCSTYHQGLDFNPTEGTPFYAVADGEVVEVHDDAWGLGKWVVIRHVVGKLSFDSLYGHMLRDSTGVHMGQTVKAGDYIGRVGNSGTSTGAHLHFEIILNGTPVDPFDWLKKHTKGN